MYSFESLCVTLLELLSCPELHSILRLVLKAGNYMNAVSHSLFILLSFSSYFQSGIHLFNPAALGLGVSGDLTLSAPGILLCGKKVK